jgi:hypothetical protein
MLFDLFLIYELTANWGVFRILKTNTIFTKIAVVPQLIIFYTIKKCLFS